MGPPPLPTLIAILIPRKKSRAPHFREIAPVRIAQAIGVSLRSRFRESAALVISRNFSFVISVWCLSVMR